MHDSAWVALSLQRHIGGRVLRALLAHFAHDLTAILNADEKALRAVPGVGPRIAAAIRAIDLPAVERQMRHWQAAGVRILPQGDAGYPARLLAAGEDAPPTLFVRGAWDAPLLARAVAVVGTRQPSPLALWVAERIGTGLAAQGATVVSGLALGVDIAAQQAALQADGRVLAVLGSGVLRIYPEQHQRLAGQVMQRGAVVAEVAPDAPVSTPGLVARNRIISGLAQALILVESAEDGGAMHAARFAMAQGRSLYVVDLPATGNQALLAQGAHPLLPDSLIHPLPELA